MLPSMKYLSEEEVLMLDIPDAKRVVKKAISSGHKIIVLKSDSFTHCSRGFTNIYKLTRKTLDSIIPEGILESWYIVDISHSSKGIVYCAIKRKK